MSRAIQKAPDFTADFESVFARYVDQAGVEVAWRFQMALDNSLVKLSDPARLGPAPPFPSSAIYAWTALVIPWSFLSRNFLIFYRVTDEAVHAVRLMHGARNPAAPFTRVSILRICVSAAFSLLGGR
jgi:plasmid stabilization system protein ParE